MSDDVRVPTPPGFSDDDRRRFEDMLGFQTRDVGPGFAYMHPAEPRGTVHDYFKAHRLCDATTPLAAETWAPLREHPAYEDQDAERPKRLLAYADALGRQPTLLAEALMGVAATVAAFPNAELPGYLEAQLPELFKLFPDGSLWLVSTEPQLLTRLIVMHAVSSLYLAPDMPLRREQFQGFQALDEHSLTRGVDFARTLDPALLAWSPATVGISFDVQPHALVFLFGKPVELVQEELPPTLASLYEPRLFEPLDDDVLLDERLIDRFDPRQPEELLRWWVGRLNVLYSFASDPRNFLVEEIGIGEPRQQHGWFLSFERLLADAIMALAGVRKPPLDRLNALFDFLDKAEVLLGYGSDRSGRAFKQLVTRGQALHRLDHYYRTALPDELRKLFYANAQALYDRVVERVLAGVGDFRRRPNAVLVDIGRDEPHPKPLDDYVAELIRATRNSAHGLIEQLDAEQRSIIGIHRGGLPAETPLLVGPLLLGFAAGAEEFCARRWLPS
jgi:hypothetical protein